MLAGKGGHVEYIRRPVLKHAAEQQVLATDENGCTALILAAISGHVECTRRLVLKQPSRA